MKRLLLFAILIGLMACNKEDSNNDTNPNNNGISGSTDENVFIVNMDGEEFKTVGTHVDIDLFKLKPRSLHIHVAKNSSDSKPYDFHLVVHKDTGSIEGIYDYDLATDIDNYTYHFDNTPDNKDIWRILTASVNVTSAVDKYKYSDSTRVKANFSLKVRQIVNKDTIYKDITGEFDSWSKI